ncbi:MAG: helix-turn-helix domain-containing protein [Candidatus Sericytochromatia bacterium]
MPEMVEFSAEALRHWRQQRKLTIKKLAEVSGVAERYIYMLEHADKVNPTLQVLRQLGKVLGIAFY